MFMKDGKVLPITHQILRKFGVVNRIGIHVFHIGYDSPKDTEHEYISIYVDDVNVKIYTLGYIT